ncbi:MAG TPA: hypothetical protein VD767_11560 [Thermomicrobiales bacterium]|nr:hypothetical protein [Thermomicrobiales bacterium]
MSRHYPLEPIEPDPTGPDARPGESIGMRMAAATAQLLLDIGAWRRRHADLSQAIIGVTLLMFGLVLGGGAAITDSYLHRGVESGSEQPYVVQPAAKTLATNVDIRPFVGSDPATITVPLAGAGFQIVRQEFSWNEIEQQRGDYTWETYDAIVTELARRGITLIAVVTETPPWARPTGTSRYANAPPRDPGQLETFARTLLDRYGESLTFVQLWDDPNLAGQWGGEPATGETYAPYLDAFWQGARAGSSSVRIISPELAPVSDGPEGETDLTFVESLYGVGAGRSFDILGMSLDGGVYSPDDRRVGETRLNMSRAILFRELMVSWNDSVTPIWATSYGWAASESVSREEQAEFVSRGLSRSWSEWPWMGVMVQWAFIANDGSRLAPYAIVLLPDGLPTPLYHELTSSEMQARSRVANTGFMPMDFAGIEYSSGWRDQHLEERTFRTTQQVGATITMQFQGTGLIAYVRSGPQVGRFTIELDGELVPGGGGEDGTEWNLALFGATQDFPRTLVDGLDDATHTVTITLTSEGELTLGGIVITREAPFVWPIVLMAVASIISLFFGLWSIAHLFAVRSGHLRRKS